MTLWHDLLGNFAVVAICISLWTFSSGWLARRRKHLPQVAFSALMTVGTLLVMMMPFEFQTGVYLDLRYTFIALSGFFGGPLAVIMPMLSAIAARFYIGGNGVWVGLSHILLTTMCALLVRAWAPRFVPRLSILGVLAGSITLCSTVGFFFVVPSSHWSHVLGLTILPFAGALSASILIAGGAVIQELRRQQVASENMTYRAIIEALPDCLNAKDRDGRFIAANPATAELMHAGTVDALLGRTDFDFYPADTAREFREVEAELLRNGEPLTVEQRFTVLNGRETWLATLKAPIRNTDGAIVGIVTHNREITSQKLVEAELALAQQRLAEAVSTMADGLVMFDANGILLFRNSRYLELFPLTADIRSVGTPLKQIIRSSLERGEDPAVTGCLETTIERIAASLMSDGIRQMQLADGRWIEARTRSTAEGGAMVVFADISRQKMTEATLQAQNSRLSTLATTDALTGLANRRAFDEALVRLTLSASREGQDLALLLIDVDRFKAYNDTYGHPAGDTCLQTVARCIKDVAAGHGASHVARYGAPWAFLH